MKKISYQSLPLSLPAFVGAAVYFVLLLSGRFNTSRIGLEGYEVRQLAVVLVLLWVLVRCLRVRVLGSVLPLMFFMVLFILAMALTAFWSPLHYLTEEKLFDACMLLVIMLSGLLIFSKDPGALIWFLIFMAVVGAAYAGSVLLSIDSQGAAQSRGSAGASGPNVATRVMFLGLLSSVFLSMHFRLKILLLAVPFFLAGVIGVGSRGGIIGASLCLLLILVTEIYSHNDGVTGQKSGLMRRLKILALVSVGGYLFFLLLFPVIKFVFEQRVLKLLVDHIHYAGRDDIFSVALASIIDNPLLGLGLGGYTSIGIYSYPHNLVLEILLDGGMFLAAAFLPLVFIVYRTFLRAKGKILYLSVACVYMLIVQMASGDYYDFRYFFVYLLITNLFLAIEKRSDALEPRGR